MTAEPDVRISALSYEAVMAMLSMLAVTGDAIADTLAELRECIPEPFHGALFTDDGASPTEWNMTKQLRHMATTSAVLQGHLIDQTQVLPKGAVF